LDDRHGNIIYPARNSNRGKIKLVIMPKETSIETKYLLQFIKSAKLHERKIDEIMKMKESVDRGKLIAKEMNRYSYALDLFLHFGIGLSFEDIKKIPNKIFKLKT
jgi:hypothetical protein